MMFAPISIWNRLCTNAANPTFRRNVATLMLGKAIGLIAVLMIISWFLPQAAHAAGDALDISVATINAVNTAWVLVAAFLVFGMQVGFVMLEAGFARERES